MDGEVFKNEPRVYPETRHAVVCSVESAKQLFSVWTTEKLKVYAVDLDKVEIKLITTLEEAEYFFKDKPVMTMHWGERSIEITESDIKNINQTQILVYVKNQLENLVGDVMEENKKLEEISKFLEGIKFSGSKCGSGPCSINIHRDNIERIREIVNR